jgi:putative endonuclease
VGGTSLRSEAEEGEIHTQHVPIPTKVGIQKMVVNTSMYRSHYVYIMASRRNGTLYIGETDDLMRRVYEHKNDLVQGFTKRYGVHKLVYYEVCDGQEGALRREKQLKKWNTAWKLRLIEEVNPGWKDIYEDLRSQ